jgi:hypothetical protein
MMRLLCGVFCVYDGLNFFTCRAAQFYRSVDWQQLANDMQNVYQVNHTVTAPMQP